MQPATLIALMGVGAILYFAQRAFIPIAMALFLAILLSPLVNRLHSWRIPRSLAAACVMLLVAALAIGAVNAVWDPARNWLERAPEVMRKIDQRVKPLRATMARFDALTRRASQLTQAQPDSTQPAAAATIAVAPSVAGGMALKVTASFLEWITVIPLALFFLIGGPPLLARMGAALAGNPMPARALKLTETIRVEVTRYFATIALINLGLGLATALALTALGMPNAFLWGSLAGVLNFVPYLGPLTITTILAAAAFVTFDRLGDALAVPAAFLVLHLIEGQIVQPLTVGHRLALNALSILLAVWFGFWFWGIPGVLLAVPSLVTLKVLAEHEPSWQAVRNFLAPNDTWQAGSARGRTRK
ncbi:MAG: AI-2E family transporter [Steroidobacteraceae bacterium]